MAETYDETLAAEARHHVHTYLKVFVALLIFTILEYFYAMFTQAHFVSLVLGLMAMAVTKATLVAMFFMHLKFEGRWPYLMLVPASVLAAALVLALYPDIGTRHSPPSTRGDEDEAAITAPSGPDVALGVGTWVASRG